MIRYLFLLILFLTLNLSFAQTKETFIFENDTTTYTVKIVSIENGHYIKETAYFTDNPSKIAFERNFLNGNQNGLFKLYYPNGKIKVKAIFYNNKLNGELSVYRNDGYLTIKGEYKNGLKHGYWAYRLKKCYGRYKHNLRNGKWKCFNQEEKKYTAYFDDGNINNKKDNQHFALDKIGEDLPPLTNNHNSLSIHEDSSYQKTINNPKYEQAINYLRSNLLLHSNIKDHYHQGFKQNRAFRKYFENKLFRFVLSPYVVKTGISTFIKESNHFKIEVPIIDSVLKQQPNKLLTQFEKHQTKHIPQLSNYSTDTTSILTVYFSQAEKNLLRIDIIRTEEPIHKMDYLSVYKNAKPEQIFRILLYFNEKNQLKGAEYEKRKAFN